MLPPLIRRNLAAVFSPSPETDRLIDGVRALSILLVIFFHAFYLHQAFLPRADWIGLVADVPVWLAWVWRGDLGVDGFFVISGFLITSLLLREQARDGRVDLPAFYRRRLARIYPAYLLLLLYGWLTAWPNRELLWTNLLGINNFLGLGNHYLTWTWSIAVELQFYLLFPPLLIHVLLPHGRPLRTLAWMLLLAVLLRPALVLLHPELYQVPLYAQFFNFEGKLAPWLDLLYLNLWTRAGPLLLGAIGALLLAPVRRARTQAWLSPARRAGPLLALALACILVPLWLPYQDPGSWFYRAVPEALAILVLGFARNLFSLGVLLWILLGTAGRGWVRAVPGLLRARMLHPVARVSYSMYLFHIPLMGPVFELVHGRLALAVSWQSLLLTALLTIALTFLVSLFTYAGVEKPFMDLARKRRARA